MNTPCSLEHCHTNLFALQSLNDMKWKCFRRAVNHRLEVNSSGRVDNYKDPVLVAYWNALHNDTLCSWRRVPTDDGQKKERELWLFAINEDLPSELPNLRTMTLANGSWNEKAISYECRSMLFKALHTMIEKYLLSKGFARLNKWFVLPINDHFDVKIPNFSFNFNFFLHGDNKVCASVDVQRHQNIYNLTNKDLERTLPFSVILAPYGISGMCIGPVNRDTDINSFRENWEKSYPLRHIDGLPDFVEVTIANARTFYPTSYVYKVGSNEESATSVENTSTRKKSNAPNTSKSKSTTITNANLDAPSTKSRTEHSLIRTIANNVLVAVQRTNCIDLDKKQDPHFNDACSNMSDPVHYHSCQCNQSLPINNRITPFTPFHRRSQPVTSVEVPTRSKADPSERENPVESIENHDAVVELTTPSTVAASTQPKVEERPHDWTASTPSSVGMTNPPSVLSAAVNTNPIATNSPASNPTLVCERKRSAVKAFDDETTEDDESDQQKRTYDFYDTDSFLELPLKRFRLDNNSSSNEFDLTIKTFEHVYQNGQPTPPSPDQLSPRRTSDFDDNEDLFLQTNSAALASNSTLSHYSSFLIVDGASTSDLGNVLDSHDTSEAQTTNTHLHNSIDNTIDNIKSPSPKENFHVPLLSVGTMCFNQTKAHPINRSLNGVLHEMEQIYNTPPNSSASADKFQTLHSPHGILMDASLHIVHTPDSLNAFIHESIVTPFESNSLGEQSIYYPLNQVYMEKSQKRYEPSKASSPATSIPSRPFRNSKQKLQNSDVSSSPFSSQQLFRQQLTSPLISASVMSHYSPVRSNDLQSSPYPSRSTSSVQTLASPMTSISPVIPEVDSFIFNVLLNDSILNLHRDINFDSCVLCACITNDLAIHGMDSTIYLEKPNETLRTSHRSALTHQQSSISSQPLSNVSVNNSCSCGFSAVVNLRLGTSSGLFYEDEIEITGVKTDVKYREINDTMPIKLLELIERKECFASPFDYFNNQMTQKQNLQDFQQLLKLPFHQYENWACRLAIDQAKNSNNALIADDIDRHLWLHQWSYLTTPLDSDQQLITMLRSLQPFLIEALRKRNVNGLWSTIDGPLTWKSFHQLLCVQNQHAHLEEQISGPQPIPYVLAGLDREWTMLAPYGLKFWDKLCLEPYSKRKDIGYVCVVPDNDYVCAITKTYFRELSTHYELCRLGLHRPLLKVLADQGLLRVPKATNDVSQLPSVDQWFTNNEATHPLGSRLKHYAQTLKDKLLNILNSLSFDNTVLDDNTSRRELFRSPSETSSSTDHSATINDLANSSYACSPTSSLLSNSTPNNIYTTGSVVTDNLNASSINLSSSTNSAMVNGLQVDPVDLQAFESYYHGRSLNDEQIFIVIYIVDTFRYELLGSSNDENTRAEEGLDIHVKKSIFRAYLDLMKDLPDKVSARINLQIIPFESIVQQQLEYDAELRLTQLKRLSFHVYDQLRQTVSYKTRAKSLTGFGPAMSEEKAAAKIAIQLYTPAYILSPKSDVRMKSPTDLTEKTSTNGIVLFCSYCLSDDQRYLLATCTDERGELLETCSINIEVPDRQKRKVQHARRIGLQKLWDFILSIIAHTSTPWRIVIDRLGRLGHGELKCWGIILSKKNLVRCATLVRESCSMCHDLRSHDHPVILSACLISTETHPLLSILPESLELGEMRGTQPSNNNTTTMQNSGQILNDISVTHILTLPISASVRHVQAISRLNDPRQLSADLEDDLFYPMFEYLEGDGFENLQSSPPDLDFLHHGVSDSGHSGNPNGYLNRLNSLSTSQHNYNSADVFGNSLSSSNVKTNAPLHADTEVDMNEIPSLHQQPLALGFYVSNIGTLNPLPLWMHRGKNSQRLNNTSSVFKATLHVNIPNAQNSDEMLLAQNHEQKLAHPLDSNYTYVVLRHVLESYHRLSWLLMDAKTNERASCLPLHMETLLKLYHAFMRLL